MAETKKKTNSKSAGTSKQAAGTKSASKTSTARQSAAPAREQRGINNQSLAIILAAAALFLFFVAVVEGESVWNMMHNFMFRVFGVCAFVLPFLLVYTAVLSAKEKTSNLSRVNLIFTGMLLLIIDAAFHIFKNTPDYLRGTAVSKQIFDAWENGPVKFSGGVLGALTGGFAGKYFGKAGAGITVVILFIASILLMTGISLPRIYAAFKKPVRMVRDAANERMEENARRREEEEQNRGEDGEESAPVSRRRRKKPIDIEVEEPEVAPGEKRPAPPKIPEIDSAVSAGTLSEPPMPDGKTAAAASAVAPAVLAGIDGAAQAGSAAAAATAAAAAAEAGKKADQAAKKKAAKKKSEEAPKEPAVTETPPAAQEKSTSKNNGEYALPPMNCLNEPVRNKTVDFQSETQEGAQLLIDTLRSFKVNATITAISRGPSVTRYELLPEAGVRISRITTLADDIALRLAAQSVRIEAPIPGKSAIGIEVPNAMKSPVSMREVVDTDIYRAGAAKSKLSVALGKNITGDIIITNLEKMPHLLVAGTTGSGKSVCLNAMIISILYNAKPDEVKLLMIDPKMVEFTIYNGISHLEVPVVSNPRKAAGALAWAVSEMEKRYQLFAECKVRDIKGYNNFADGSDELKKMPHIVIFIDELSDLMMQSPKEVEDSICRLAQKARAAGIHMVIATQRPSVDVITGIIKANIPSRIALMVSSQIDSRTIIDQPGAETLLGYGDMLFKPVGASKPQRVQGCFITDEEVERVVSYIKRNSTAEYNDDTMREIEEKAAAAENKKGAEAEGDEDALDPMFDQAAEAVIVAGQASTTMLQKKLKLGYARASRVMDQLEERGIVGPSEGAKPRQVLVSKQEWYERQALAEGSKNVQLEFNTDPPAQDGFDEDYGEDGAGEDPFDDDYTEETPFDGGLYDDEAPDGTDDAQEEEDGFADIYEDDDEDADGEDIITVDFTAEDTSGDETEDGGDGDFEVVDLNGEDGEQDGEGEYYDDFEDLEPTMIDDVFSDDDFYDGDDDDSFFS